MSRQKPSVTVPDGSPLDQLRQSDQRTIAHFLHDEWSVWMSSLLTHGQKQADGSVLVPAGLVKEWQRQMGFSLPGLEASEQRLYMDRAERLLKRLEGTP